MDIYVLFIGQEGGPTNRHLGEKITQRACPAVAVPNSVPIGRVVFTYSKKTRDSFGIVFTFRRRL